MAINLKNIALIATLAALESWDLVCGANITCNLDAYCKGSELLLRALNQAPAGDFGRELKSMLGSSYDIKHIPNFGTMFVERIDDVIKNRLRAGGTWEGDITPYITSSIRQHKSGIVLDIGAHIGTHTITMSETMGNNGIVIAFEPQKKIFRELYINLELNKCHNVIPVQCALGLQTATMKICPGAPCNEGSSYVMPEGAGESILVMRLDDFNLNNVSFIKIDTENTEDDVLEGGRETILRCKPIILIEIQGNEQRPYLPGETRESKTAAVIKKLQDWGYQIKHITHAEYIAYPIGK